MTTTPQRRSFEPPPSIDTAAYARLAHGLRGLIGIDIDQYRPAQMWRRITGFATTRGLPDAEALIGACQRDSKLLAELRDMLTINVSEFFRSGRRSEMTATRRSTRQLKCVGMLLTLR